MDCPIPRSAAFRTRIAAALLALAPMTAGIAAAHVVRIEIERREPFAAGMSFGAAGPYERIVGRFHGELDPDDPLNAVIVDLDRAPRNARGRVEYSADFDILKPVDAARGNGTLLYDVNDRGRRRALHQFNSAPESEDPKTATDAGNGFLLRHGYTVVWSGWLADLPAGRGLLRLSAPVAAGVEGPVWDEFLADAPGMVTGPLSFRPLSLDPAKARLSVRRRNLLAAEALPPGAWAYAGERAVRLLPEGRTFEPGAIYQFTYRAADPPVAGTGFAAVRDLVAFLRHAGRDAAGLPGPLAGIRFERAIAHGTSQGGRFLRDFVHRGFNEDEAGRIVFDGILPHAAVARLFLNQRFAQPDRPYSLEHGAAGYPDARFPFAYETQRDPLTRRTDGLLALCAERRNCPRVVHTVTSTEYWQAGQSLVTTDAPGTRDGAPPSEVRIYHVAGTQHAIGPTMPAHACALPPNTEVDPRPVLRMALAALDRWVRDGTRPPPSVHPRVGDGTLVATEALVFPRIPGAALPGRPNPQVAYDYGPDYDRGIVSHAPPEPDGRRYGVLVPGVDADGNEIAGIRLPAIAAPLGTATGWQRRSAAAGAEGALCHLDGGFVPFAASRAGREAALDPRPSLAERYGDIGHWRNRVRDAARALVAQGYLLQEDAERIVERANALGWWPR